MGDWIHCNLCMRIPSSEESVAFFFTSCGHLICKFCIQKGGIEPHCKVCSQKATCIEINSQLKPEVKELFLQPKNTLVKNCKKVTRILEFQEGQYSKMTKNYQDQMKRAQKMVRYFQGEMKKKQEMEVQFKKLLEEHQRLKQETRHLKQSNKELTEALGSRQQSANTPSLNYRSRQSNTPGTVTQNRSNNALLMSFDNSFHHATTSTPAVVSSGGRLTMGVGGNSGGGGGSGRGGNGAQTPGGGFYALTGGGVCSEIIASPVQSEITTPKLMGVHQSASGIGPPQSDINPYNQLWKSGGAAMSAAAAMRGVQASGGGKTTRRTPGSGGPNRNPFTMPTSSNHHQMKF